VSFPRKRESRACLINPGFPIKLGMTTEMNKAVQIFLAIIIVTVFIFLCWQISGLWLEKEVDYKVGKACINSNCFAIEFAENDFQIRKGLMFRESLADDNGMLFVFDKEAIYPFWMKNTKIPLDIIWINKNKKIIFISENTQPCKNINCPQVNPQKDAKYVLEINSGLCQKFNIKIGNEVKIYD